MNEKANNRENGKLRNAVRLRQQRRERWDREGERPIWHNLSMIGALGWLIVTPTLLGILLGRWLDVTLDSGIFFTGSLIFVGISIGCYLAWQKVNEE